VEEYLSGGAGGGVGGGTIASSANGLASVMTRGAVRAADRTVGAGARGGGGAEPERLKKSSRGVARLVNGVTDHTLSKSKLYILKPCRRNHTSLWNTPSTSK
jgi:PPE-repeat protein